MAEWYDELLDRQLERNREIWADLREQGVGDDDELRLGFIFVAPGVAEADQLVAFLSEETDYEMSARLRPGDDDETDPDWIVIGTTQPTPVTLELVDDWCEWMIAAGAAEGPCAFDGWAAQLVGDDAGELGA
jgi:Regulator of ribonuclease activity B